MLLIVPKEKARSVPFSGSLDPLSPVFATDLISDTIYLLVRLTL